MTCNYSSFNLFFSSVLLHLPYYSKVTEVYTDTGIIYLRADEQVYKEIDGQTDINRRRAYVHIDLHMKRQTDGETGT